MAAAIACQSGSGVVHLEISLELSLAQPQLEGFGLILPGLAFGCLAFARTDLGSMGEAHASLCCCCCLARCVKSDGDERAAACQGGTIHTCLQSTAGVQCDSAGHRRALSWTLQINQQSRGYASRVCPAGTSAQQEAHLTYLQPLGRMEATHLVQGWQAWGKPSLDAQRLVRHSRLWRRFEVVHNCRVVG